MIGYTLINDLIKMIYRDSTVFIEDNHAFVLKDRRSFDFTKKSDRNLEIIILKLKQTL